MSFTVGAINIKSDTPFPVGILHVEENDLRRILNKHVTHKQDWVSPAGLVFSLAGIVFATDFTWGVFAKYSRELKGAFCILLLAAFIYMVYVIVNCIRKRNSIEIIVKEVAMSGCGSEKQQQ